MHSQKGHENDRLLWESDVLGIRALNRPRQYSYRGDGYFECQEDVRFDLAGLQGVQPKEDKPAQEVAPVRGVDDPAVRQRLGEAIRASGMRYKDLSLATGLSLSRITSYASKDDTLPGIKATIKLCQALGISADWLFGLEAQGKPEQ